MARSTTSSFVLTLPLKYSSTEACILDKRFEIARKIYNALLSRMLKELKTLKESTEYTKQVKHMKKLKLEYARLKIESEKERERNENESTTYW